MSFKVKCSGIVILLVISIPDVFGIEWKFSSSRADEILYRAKEFSDLIGILKLNYTKKDINWNKSDLKLFSDELQENKKEVLKYIGITKWISSNTKWFKSQNHYRLILSGSYINSDKEKIFFKEFHYYFKNKNWQSILTEKNEAILNKVSDSFQDQIEANFEI